MYFAHEGLLIQFNSSCPKGINALGGIYIYISDLNVTFLIGCGVNICNAHPTISINNSIALFNKETGASLPPLSVEQTLARTFNWLEELLSLYEVEGEKPILQLYYKYWLHRCAGRDFLCVGMGLHVNYLHDK